MAENSPVLQGLAPWGLHPLPKFVKNELELRSKKYASKDLDAVRSAWLRVCSNGMPLDPRHPAHKKLEGFVFFGPNKNVNYEAQMGFSHPGQPVGGGQVIGYDVNNQFHYLQSQTFPNRPPPAMESMENEYYGAGSSFPGMCRKSTLKWKCFSKEQLEYVTPYLMSARVSIVVEWGWNNYDPVSLIDIKDKKQLIELFTFPSIKGKPTGLTINERNSKSNGNYDCHLGIIIDYGYTMNSQGIYEGYTVVTSPTRVFEGNTIVNQAIEAKEEHTVKSFREFVRNHFGNLPSYFSGKKTSQPDKLIPGFDSWINTLKGKKSLLFQFDQSNGNVKPNPTPNFWISFRLLEALLNYYATVRVFNNTDPLFTFNFSQVIIGGRPFLKSITTGTNDRSLDVIIPNMFAPRAVKISGLGKSSGNLSDVSATTVPGAGVDYSSVAKDMSSAMKKQYGSQNISDEYDDLKTLLNSENSFPMFSAPAQQNPDPDAGRTTKPGYWGYLGDLYISDTLVMKAVESSDTFQKMIEHIFGIVTTAGSGIWQFRVIPNSQYGITVIDEHYTPIYDSTGASSLVNFVVGKTEGTSFTSYGMTIKMSNEMAMQTLLGGKASTDIKTVSQFVDGDRLFEIEGQFTSTTTPPMTQEDKDAETAARKKEDKEKKAAEQAQRDKEARRTSDTGFISYITNKGVQYLVNEKDPEFMKDLTQLKPDNSPAVAIPFPGTEFTFASMGISGFYLLGLFTLDAVPAPYNKERAVFQIRDAKSIVEGNNWKTTVIAQVRPFQITQ